MSTGQVKVSFNLNQDEGHGYDTETVWAEALGEGFFRILNSPFFALGISQEDIVRASRDGELYHFQQVVQRGGHSTYRLFLQRGLTVHEDAFKQRWRELAALYRTFENADDRLAVVDVPPHSEWHKFIRKFMSFRNMSFHR